MKQRFVVLAGMLAAGVAGFALGGGRAADPKDSRLFELRIYYAEPGKMDDLHARFRNHTCGLFKKHGIELLGFWSPTDPEKAKTEMYYILAYPNKAAADKSWKGFRDDPEWTKVKTESEKNGKLVNKVTSVYMNPTDYSAMK
jgi:hypothetical protein